MKSISWIQLIFECESWILSKINKNMLKWADIWDKYAFENNGNTFLHVKNANKEGWSQRMSKTIND